MGLKKKKKAELCFYKVRYVPNKGRGLIAQRNIKRGETIELSEVILISSNEWEHIKMTVLNWYVFAWSEFNIALALSNMSLLNHSKKPNLDYFALYDEELIEFKARRNIKKGEELTIDYGEDAQEDWT